MKTVTMIAVDHVRIESTEGLATPVAPGTIITDVDIELATMLAGNGKARIATAEEIESASKPKPQKPTPKVEPKTETPAA